MLSIVAALAFQSSSEIDYSKDFEGLLADLKTYNAYIPSDGVDLEKLGAAYRPRIASIASPLEALRVLEAFISELHDFHAFLNTNTEGSPNIVPSSTDLYGVWKGNRAFVEQTRPTSLAAEADVRAGDEIVEIDGKPTEESVATWMGVRVPDERAKNWALNSALAGRWSVSRKIRLRRGGKDVEVTLASAKSLSMPLLNFERRANGVIVLCPGDSLGDLKLIQEFDRLVPELRKAKGIVLDLRNTQSGGNTAVARGIMGLFVGKRLPYQRHQMDERETGTVRDWTEYVMPRLPTPIAAPMVVLVSRWTGSMGEGIALGFDAMKRATVIGTGMASLRGAVGSTDMPAFKLRVFFPIERLYHVNGTPRHEWLPRVRIQPGAGDPWMAAADRILKR